MNGGTIDWKPYWERGEIPETTPRARSGDRDTSHEAAASVQKMTETKHAILRVYEKFGAMTDTRLIEIYRNLQSEGERGFPLASESGLRTRRKELERVYLVEACEWYDTLPSGRKATVFDISEKGRKVVATWTP